MILNHEPEKMSWRERDEQILQLAYQHVVCARHFFDFFGSKQAAYRRIKKLVEGQQLRKVGEVMIGDSGRPESVYANGWKPKYDQLRHEVTLTDFLLLYPEADIVRGWQYVHRTIRPDAEMTLNGQLCYIELDTGHESLGQVQRRQRVYRGVDELVLYVTLLSPRRVRGLISVSKAIAGIVLFTTLAEATDEPRGQIWGNCEGDRFGI